MREPLRIHLIGDKTTKKAALEYIAKGLEELYPRLVTTRLSKRRYDRDELSIENGGLVTPSNTKEKYISANYIDGKFREFIGDDFLLILTHWPFCVERPDRYEWHRHYDGTCITKDDGPELNNFIAIAGDNDVSKPNLILAGHETFHALSGTEYGDLFDHCEGVVYKGEKPYHCLMYPIGDPRNKERMEGMAVEFCSKCKKKMEAWYEE